MTVIEPRNVQFVGIKPYTPAKLVTEPDTPKTLRHEAQNLMHDADDLKRAWVDKCRDAYAKCISSIHMSLENYQDLDPAVEELRSRIVRELKNAGESV